MQHNSFITSYSTTFFVIVFPLILCSTPIMLICNFSGAIDVLIGLWIGVNMVNAFYQSTQTNTKRIRSHQCSHANHPPRLWNRTDRSPTKPPTALILCRIRWRSHTCINRLLTNNPKAILILPQCTKRIIRRSAVLPYNRFGGRWNEPH